MLQDESRNLKMTLQNAQHRSQTLHGEVEVLQDKLKHTRDLYKEQTVQLAAVQTSLAASCASQLASSRPAAQVDSGGCG